MRRALWFAAAAMLALGCAANKKMPRPVPNLAAEAPAAPSLEMATASGGVQAQPARPVRIELDTRRPSKREVAVHDHWSAERDGLIADADVPAPDPLSKARREAREMVEKKARSVVMGGVDEPGMNSRMTAKRQREARQVARTMRRAAMNSLDEPRGTDPRRVDLEMSDVNLQRANGAGLVGIRPRDGYLGRSECPNGSCVNHGVSRAGQARALANTLDP